MADQPQKPEDRTRSDQTEPVRPAPATPPADHAVEAEQPVHAESDLAPAHTAAGPARSGRLARLRRLGSPLVLGAAGLVLVLLGGVLGFALAAATVGRDDHDRPGRPALMQRGGDDGDGDSDSDGNGDGGPGLGRGGPMLPPGQQPGQQGVVPDDDVPGGTDPDTGGSES